MTKPYLSPVAFRFLAHRGLTVGAAGEPIDENTAPAFARALVVGAGYLEVDVHASRDGIAIVCHDETLERVAGNPAAVSELTWNELSQIRLHHGATLISLEQLLKTFDTARVNIDIKSMDAAVPTAAVIRALGAHDRVLISSFSESRRAATVALLPGIASSGSASQLLKTWLAYMIGSKTLLRRSLAGLDALQIPPSRGALRFDSEKFISAVKAFGVEVHYWTINDPEQAKTLRARGANGVVSDRIDLIAAALAE